jgi:hypothetical protein
MRCVQRIRGNPAHKEISMTKLLRSDLQQKINELTVENGLLRSELNGVKLANEVLRRTAQDADIRTRRVIAQTKRETEVSPRRAAMLEAKAQAQVLGTSVKVGGRHV